ncbi:fungal-specific transcription factor [Leptodontidium sp. MPI-SDFR-AT-0119]|nr:fungal-specific transcription factor [Leptodontidium sp. MPI-SDFR-AT-0119]
MDSGDSPAGTDNAARIRRKTVACRRCHARKVKCSGRTPCDGCITALCENDCVYLMRDRRVKVAESYLQQVLAENEQLKRRLAMTSNPSTQETSSVVQAQQEPSASEDNLSNPLMQERAWFVVSDAETPPIYIGEVACTAFATRFRQSLALYPGSTHHIPRIHYVQDEDLLSVPNEATWPTRSHARLLLRVALANINRGYYVVLPKPTMAKLEEMYQDPNLRDPLVTCKFFALFALGEVYSSRVKAPSGGNFPGLSYFIRACSLIPMLPERTNLEHIEILILLSFFSHNLNRRNSAYLWIGSALRLALTIGLHHNLPGSIALDPVAREHRVRIWWTIYICDRMWGSKLGHPLMIPDTNITVDLPSNSMLTEEAKAEFSDPAYIIASIKLARIAGEIVTSIYCRGHPPPFIQSVQRILRSLNAWMAALPESVRLSKSGSSARHVVSLHLSFNQCVILATRPVLLHVFTISRIMPTHGALADNIAPVISTLAEACLRTARHSNELLTEVWIDGTLSTFGYFDAQYLFSSAVILAISSVTDVDGRDSDLVEAAAQLLQSMANCGNLSAIEFCGHLDQVRADIKHHCSATTATLTMPELDSLGGARSIFDNTTNRLTAEMALLEPPMLDFLTQTELYFDFPNPMDMFQNTMHL